MAFFFNLVGHNAAVDAPCFFSEPTQMVHGEGNFILALGEGFSVFKSNDAGDFLSSAVKFGGDLVEHFATAFAGDLAPGKERGVGILKGFGDSGAIDRRHAGEDFVGSGILDGVRILGDG
jgi:hypothetical protein